MIGRCLILVALTMCASVAGRSVREAPQTVEFPTSFGEFFEQAVKSLKDLEKNFFSAVGVDNAEQLEEKAVKEGKEYATKLDGWALDVKKETDGLKDNALVKDLRTTVDKVVEDWKAKNPETAEDVKKYVEKVNVGADEIITKIKQLGDSEEAKNIKDLSAKLLDTAKNTFNSVSEEILKNIKANAVKKD